MMDVLQKTATDRLRAVCSAGIWATVPTADLHIVLTELADAIAQRDLAVRLAAHLVCQLRERIEPTPTHADVVAAEVIEWPPSPEAIAAINAAIAGEGGEAKK